MTTENRQTYESDKMSETPRTDAGYCVNVWQDTIMFAGNPVIKYEVSAQLERELTAANAELVMWRDGNIVTEDVQQMKARIAELEKENEWHPASEFPKQYKSVIGWGTNMNDPVPRAREVYITEYDDWESVSEGRDIVDVSHWREMPTPPKGGV